MTENTGTATEKVAIIKLVPPELIGGIIVHGHNLVSHRLLDMIGLFQDEFPGSGITNIMFRNDNEPKQGNDPVHAKFFPEIMGLVVNLSRHLTEIYKTIEADDNRINMRALWWHTMLITLLHEWKHAIQYTNAPLEERAFDKIFTKEAEEEAENWANTMLFELAKKPGNLLEMPDAKNCPMFWKFVKDFQDMVEGEADKDLEKWMITQKRMLDEGTIFEDTDNDQRFMSFRGYLRAISDDPDDESWNVNEGAAVTAQTEAAPTPVDASGFTPENAVLSPAESEFIPSPDISNENDMYVDVMLEAVIQSQMNAANLNPPAPAAAPAVEPTSTETAPWETPAVAPQPLPTPAVTAPQAYVPEVWQNNVSTAPVGQYNQPGNVIPSVVQVPVVTLPADQQKMIVQAIFTRLFQHLFSKCMFNPVAPTSFDDPNAVLNYAVRIDDIPGSEQLVLSHDFGDQAITIGQPGSVQERQPIGNGLCGIIMKNTRLPSFSLRMNVGGLEKQWKLIPQNPNKTNKDGQLTASAVRVRQNGSAIAWVFEETARNMDNLVTMAFEQHSGQQMSMRWYPFAK